MAAELRTPVDELTGIPLPLIALDAAPSRFGPDLHHPFHPKRSDELADLGGQAVRNCRVQLVPYTTHHYDYHNTYVGPELPTSVPEQLSIVVLAAAGYVPTEGLMFDSRHRPRIMTLTSEQRLQLWDRRQMRVGLRKSVQKFLLEQAFSQDFTEISAASVDEFLNTTEPARRWELGNTLLGLGAYRATEPVRELYSHAYKAELLAPENARVASRFMLSTLGLRRHRYRLHQQLRDRLQAA